ncbi:MAG: tetratricopeptide repeat protein [Spirosomaceae bacterium]|nr:tetratricopeptide repeat protein [Spirosomataceae bacterium]
MRKYIYLLLILIATTLIYSNHFNNSFQFDDSHTIVNNLYIRDIENIPLFFKDGTTFSTLPLNQAYRPGVTTLNAIDFYLAGEPLPVPYYFHLSIFISYLLLGFLCYLLFIFFLKNSLNSQFNEPIALFTTAWFLFHTANAETINYIIARSDSFSTLMIVLTFVLYLYFPNSRRLHWYIIPAIIGFFVKEHTIMIIPLLVVYKLLFEEDSAMNEWFSNSPKTIKVLKSVIVPTLIAILLFAFSQYMTPKTWVPGGTDRWKYLFTQPFVIFHYVYNFILPINLAVDTDWQVISTYKDDRVLAGILFVLTMLMIAFKTSKTQENRPISFGILWFFIALVPTSSILPFAEVLNDHRTFFAYIGLFLAAATSLRNYIINSDVLQSSFKKAALFSILGLYLGFNAYGTYKRNIIWKTSESLWKDCTINAPKNGRAWMNYGIELMAKGDFAAAQSCYEKTISLWPDYPYVFINMGITKAALGNFTEADENFKKGLSYGPLIPDSYSFYARFLINQKRFDEAKVLIDKGLKISPRHQSLLEILAEYNAAIGDTKSLKEEKTIKLIGKHTTLEDYLELSLKYYNGGDFKNCIEAAQLALSLKPDYSLAYNNICAAYNRLGKWKEAIEAAEKGLKIDPNNQLLHGNLAEARRGLSTQK